MMSMDLGSRHQSLLVDGSFGAEFSLALVDGLGTNTAQIERGGGEYFYVSGGPSGRCARDFPRAPPCCSATPPRPLPRSPTVVPPTTRDTAAFASRPSVRLDAPAVRLDHPRAEAHRPVPAR